MSRTVKRPDPNWNAKEETGIRRQHNRKVRREDKALLILAVKKDNFDALSTKGRRRTEGWLTW